MYRAIPVGNRACAERVRQRNDEKQRQRLRDVKPQVDTREPSVSKMDHLRNNFKREQKLEERYHEIDRDNRMLLQKMSEIMKQSKGSDRARSSPPSINRDNRKQELMRITQENGHILRRIQQAQPVYNHIQWEDEYKQSFTWMKNRAEFPVVLNRKSSRPTSLTPLGAHGKDELGSSGGAALFAFAPGEVGGRQSPQEELRYVLKEGKNIGEKYYLIEMATDGRTLAISAYDSDKQTTLELLVNEKNHRRLHRDHSGNYAAVAQRLRVEGNQLLLDVADSGEATNLAK